MYLIVGLGNPEEDYARTRHNMGFDVVNSLAKEYEIEISRTNFKALYGSGIIEDQKVIILKPQTYMNSSGESIIECKKFYKLENSQIIVISDDIDLEPGNIRIRKKGCPGTHNGLKSVVHCLNTDDFVRVRVGVGQPAEGIELVEHVIGYVPDKEYKILQTGIEKAKEALIEIIKNGPERAMNKYNAK
mgnify:FL=1